ncbi:hypothetical protein CJP74_00485 [Psittacicella melopsittaci]|uniref:Glycosyltransferase family 8 protein n=1 Tax=Psittacicella melopsittaci TaxID=2028576 RepID=A0A3A1YCJ0_9GAMM|nr:glycosyltransferase [Psittacicella melopsittaci]RIY33934.1 hypothetical protein CJP74_00485 [Psittacicella melopsittaci]
MQNTAKVNQLAFNTNEAFLPHLETLLKTYIAFNREPARAIILHNIADVENSKIAQDFINNFKAYPNLEINFHYVSPQDFLKLGVREQDANNVANYRLLLPTLPYQGIVLYLDVDVMIVDNIEELFNAEVLQGNSLGVVPDLCNIRQVLNRKKFFREKCFIPEVLECNFGYNNLYFNSGVLLCDLDKLRSKAKNPGQDVWTENLGKYLDRKTLMPDQDFLNLIHLNDKTEISSVYNYPMRYLISQRFYLNYYGWDKVEPPADKVKKVRPKILHFLEKRKQWDSLAPEWTDLYNYFKQQSITQIVENSTTIYTDLLSKYYQYYEYEPCLEELNNTPALQLTRKSFRKLWKEKREPWQINQILINYSYAKIPLFFEKYRFKKAIIKTHKDESYAKEIYEKKGKLL